MKRFGIAFLIAVALSGCRGDQSLPPAPSYLIQDALHSGGNQFFFWLSPVINQQAPATQVFSKQLHPRLVITNLCDNSVVRTFAGSDIQVSSAAYHVDWHTALDNLNPACNYRLTVSVASQVLGLADVDVVSSGSQLKNVNTGEYIALLDDRTLPIQFFIGVGALCVNASDDCGEGTATPGANAVIVTTNGQAGVFIPAGAVSGEVTVTIESSNDRPCIATVPAPDFSGPTGSVGNACYDFHTDPPLSQVNETGRFNTPVTVGICPDANAFALDHATLDLLQIFQFDGTDFPTLALNNVPAPFLKCDPGFSPTFGMAQSGFGAFAARTAHALLAPLAALLSPRPAYARSMMMFDLGAGGSSSGFSRFVWGLPFDVRIDFDKAPDGAAVAPGTAVNTLYSRSGVTFSRTDTLGSCAGVNVYATDNGPVSAPNAVTVCPEGIASDFSEATFGAIVARFTIPQAEVCIDATPANPVGTVASAVGYIEAYDANGALIGTRVRSGTSGGTICAAGNGIMSVQFAGDGTGFSRFDNLEYYRLPPVRIQ